MRNRECQTETKLDMPILGCGDPELNVAIHSDGVSLQQSNRTRTSDAQEQNAEPDSEISPIPIAQDSCMQDSNLGTTDDGVTSQLELKDGNDGNNGTTHKRPISLLDSIPSFRVVSDREDSISPIPECSLVPRKREKHVSFREEGSFAPIEPAPAAADTDSGHGDRIDELGDDSDAK